MVCVSSCGDRSFILYLMEGINSGENNPIFPGATASNNNPDADDEDHDDEDIEGDEGHSHAESQHGEARRSLEYLDEERIEGSRDPMINAADVLCGRGKTSFNHVGNKRFRDMVNAALDDYMRADTRFEKQLVVHKIMDRIHAAGGRFLKKTGGRWHELPQQQSKEKVGHAVRDASTSYENKMRKGEEQGLQLAAPVVFAGRRASLNAPQPPAEGANVPLPPPLRDYSDSSASTGRRGKRPAAAPGSSPEHHQQHRRKRRRSDAAETSPPHLPAEEALRSASLLAANIPRTLKRSPIVATPQQPSMSVGGGGGTQRASSMDSVASGLVASLPQSLRRSPIEQNPTPHRFSIDHQLQAIGQQQHQPQHHQRLGGGRLPHSSHVDYSSRAQALSMEHEQQRRSSYPTFDSSMQYNPIPSLPMQQQQQSMHLPPPTLPLAPHAIAAAAASMLHPQQQHQHPLTSTRDMMNLAAAALPPPSRFGASSASYLPRQPDMITRDVPRGMDPVVRMQMMQRERQQLDQYYQQRLPQHQPLSPVPQYHPHHQPNMPPLPGGRSDEPDPFSDMINAVLGPLDVDDPLLASYDETSAQASEAQQQQRQQRRLSLELLRRQQELLHPRRRSSDDDEGESPPSQHGSTH